MEKINYAWPVTSVNREDYRYFEKWYESHLQLINDCSIIIWGAGIRGTEFSVFFKKKDYMNIYFTDSNEEKWGGCINEFTIISTEEAFKMVDKHQARILISTENSGSIEDNLNERGYIKSVDYYVIKTDLYDGYAKEFIRPYKNRILVMGDCEFTTVSLKDTDMSNLAEMLRKQLGNEYCKVLAMHGMGLRSHYHIFRAQIMNGMVPDILVIMINLDTLTGKQHLLPRSQHEELLKNIYTCLKDKDTEFEQYLETVHERSKNVQIEFSINKVEQKKQQQNEMKARNYFKLNYLYQLNVETEGLIYLTKMFGLAKEYGIDVIPFVPPVNYEYGEKLFDRLFYERYDANIRRIAELVKENGYQLLDLSYLLPSSMFAEENTPDETANEDGRKMVTDRIVLEIGRYK